jgi:hypothetical protein
MMHPTLVIFDCHALQKMSKELTFKTIIDVTLMFPTTYLHRFSSGKLDDD